MAESQKIDVKIDSSTQVCLRVVQNRVFLPLFNTPKLPPNDFGFFISFSNGKICLQDEYYHIGNIPKLKFDSPHR